MLRNYLKYSSGQGDEAGGVPDEMCFDGLVLDAALRSGIDRFGRAIRFTRAERVVLETLIGRGGHVVSRDRLLDALTGRGSDASDRSVDFIIFRLRGKLGDSAGTPNFIATRYGEGYVWVAPKAGPAPGEKLLSVLVTGGIDSPDAFGILDRLLDELGQLLDPKRIVQRAESNAARYDLDVSGWESGGRLHVALLLYGGLSRAIVATFRVVFVLDGENGGEDGLARVIASAMWRDAALGGAQTVPHDMPLELRLHEAGKLFANSPAHWMANEEQMARHRKERPDDPVLALTWALHLYARLLPTPDPERWLTTAHRRQMEQEIENLVFTHLPRLSGEPLLLLAAAKLLFYIDRGHLSLAERLAEDALLATPAFAAAFVTCAQLRAARGRFSEATALYDEALARMDDVGDFRIYTMNLKAIALLASGHREALDGCCAEIYAASPITRLNIGLLVADPGLERLEPDLEAILIGMTAERASGMLDYLHDSAARHFVEEDHRRNVMTGAVKHVLRALGPEAVPPDYLALTRNQIAAGKRDIKEIGAP